MWPNVFQDETRCLYRCFIGNMPRGHISVVGNLPEMSLSRDSTGLRLARFLRYKIKISGELKKMKNLVQKYKYHVLAAMIFAVSINFCYSLIFLSSKNQVLKADAAEIKSIKYGLFSVNQWKTQLFLIVTDQISNMDIKGNKKDIKSVVEIQLSKLIDTVDQKMKMKNSESVSGKLKQAFINTFVDMKEIKQGIPEYAEEIIKVMQQNRVKLKVQTVLQDKVETYFDSTFQAEDMSRINGIIARAEAVDIADAKNKLQDRINENNSKIAAATFGFLAFAILIFFLVAFFRKQLVPVSFFTLSTLLIVLLVSGVSLPMIDLEAKISEMSFVLLDHPVKFTDQIIYFQSKSVLDVFMVMITNPEIQMKIVGILIVIFSVVFPILKMLSAIVYYFDLKRLRQNRIVQFFVLKSGKWSMTDVMIIAIFMAYIGFNGIISSQLDELAADNESVMLLATNGTSLQSGFFLFFGYAMLALVFSELLVHRDSKVLPT